MALFKKADAPFLDFTNYVAGVTENPVERKYAGVIQKVDPHNVYSVVIGIQGDTWNENNDWWDYQDTLLAPHKIAGVKHQYLTWKGKPNCLNHMNRGPEDHYGHVVDCWHMPLPSPQSKTAAYDPSKDILMVLATDRRRNPKLVKQIENGDMTTVSMGCAVGHSTCSVCGNKAETERDYCPHIRYQKGRVIPVNDGMNYHKSAAKQGPYSPMMRVGEICHDITGAEMSWVGNPAFLGCVKLDQLAASKGGDALPQHRASLTEKMESIIDPRRHQKQISIFAQKLQRHTDPLYREAGRAIEKMAAKQDPSRNELHAFTELINAFRHK